MDVFLLSQQLGNRVCETSAFRRSKFRLCCLKVVAHSESLPSREGKAFQPGAAVGAKIDYSALTKQAHASLFNCYLRQPMQRHSVQCVFRILVLA